MPALRLLAVLLALLLGPAAAAAQEQGQGDQPLRARMGFFLTALHDLDAASGRFSFAGIGWVIDPGGRLKPTEDIEMLARDTAVTVLSSERLPDGGQYTTLAVSGTVDQHFDTTSFPFDEQVLRIRFELQEPAERIVFVPDQDQSRVADFVAVNGWHIESMALEEETVEYDTGFGVSQESGFSRVTLLVNISRERSPLVVEKFLGYTVAMLIAALVYFVPTDQIGVRVGMVTSAIFAAVGNRYSLDTLLGAETEFGLVDALSIIVFGSIYVALLTSLFVHRTHVSGTAARAARMDRIAALVAVPAAFLSAAIAISLARS
jgi:hypothetical protein